MFVYGTYRIVILRFHLASTASHDRQLLQNIG